MRRQSTQSAAGLSIALIGVASLLLMLLAAPAAAQILPGFGASPQTDQVTDMPSGMTLPSSKTAPATMFSPSGLERRVGTYGPVVDSDKNKNQQEIPPFGADLFKGGFRGPMGSGLNPDYEIRPGDRVVLRVWGAVEINGIFPVDAKGNIFIPYVGPVHVAGVEKRNLKARIKAAIHEVFTDNVSVYTSLQGVQPVAVFVTGYVEKPGRYAGPPNASLLYFLDQASGIEENTGSYRHIRIMRDGQTIATVDLYDFLLHGKLPDIKFQTGDTIVVEARGPVVTVTGDVAHPYRYELYKKGRTGKALLKLVQLDPSVTHALLYGVREQGAISAYMPLSEFKDSVLQAGDRIYFSSDQHPHSIVVQIEGSYKGPSRYVVPEDTTLRQLLHNIAVNPELAAVNNIFIRRESVARRQRKALRASLRRLQMSYLSASSGTVEEARIRVKEAKLIQKFVQQALKMEPSGVLVVAHNGEIQNIRLQDGDEIVIPEESHTVLIVGEVLMPRAMIYMEGMDAHDYIQRVGGFTDRADEDSILIVRQSGAIVPASEADVRPGDKIMVLPEAPTKNLQLASTLTEIIYQIAVSTAAVLSI